MGFKKGKLPDDILLRMLLSEDRALLDAAIDNLMEFDGPDIVRMLHDMRADKDEAKDFRSLAFELLLMELKKPEPQIEKPGAWLATAAKNRWLNELERRKRFQDIAEEMLRNPVNALQFNAEKAMRVIEKTLEHLGFCKQILIWRFLDGFDLTQIADRLRLSPGEAVRRRIEECLRQARQMGGGLDYDFT